MCTPALQEVLIGIIAVVGATLLGSYAFYFARNQRNPLWLVVAIGLVVLVVGVIGQRAYYLSADQTKAGCVKTVATKPGIWDASITLPILGLHLNLITLIGTLMSVVGFTLILFFERIDDQAQLPLLQPPSFEEEDAN